MSKESHQAMKVKRKKKDATTKKFHYNPFMSDETRKALARFQEITGIVPTRFTSNKGEMQPFFTIWVMKDAKGVAKTMRTHSEVGDRQDDRRTLNGLPYVYLIDEYDDGTVRFDIDRDDLLTN
jgi:hypothetical protein